ncbi:hypothetical protein EVAR_50645_1 [Eumeta japonica]|uniref:Uncharacterized protein n=1 Tax=Eumeta variegata TaxID=151549 RepID=A0A4C1XG10_EUMVA|nr:hypothetical protein EVAR_50645_1 [Eumeta japonica]
MLLTDFISQLAPYRYRAATPYIKYGGRRWAPGVRVAHVNSKSRVSRHERSCTTGADRQVQTMISVPGSLVLLAI